MPQLENLPCGCNSYLLNVCVCFFSPEADQWLLLDKASLVAQIVNNLPAMQETWVQVLSQEDPLEKGMATYSSILAWKNP